MWLKSRVGLMITNMTITLSSSITGALKKKIHRFSAGALSDVAEVKGAPNKHHHSLKLNSLHSVSQAVVMWLKSQVSSVVIVIG